MTRTRWHSGKISLAIAKGYERRANEGRKTGLLKLLEVRHGPCLNLSQQTSSTRRVAKRHEAIEGAIMAFTKGSQASESSGTAEDPVKRERTTNAAGWADCYPLSQHFESAGCIGHEPQRVGLREQASRQQPFATEPCVSLPQTARLTFEGLRVK